MRFGDSVHQVVAAILAVAVSLTLAARATAQATEPSTQPALAGAALPGTGKIVALDYFYNHQVDKDGKQFAYIWEDTGPLGYSQFGEIWKKAGATLAHMDHAPTRADLDRVSVYIIASPSNEQNAAGHKPNYIEQPAIDTIVAWVKDGGVLAVFANSRGNCDIEHLDDLAEQFGITFSADQKTTVTKPGDDIVTFRGSQIATFPEQITFSGDAQQNKWGFPDFSLFRQVKGIYIEESSVIRSVQEPARTLLDIHHYWKFKEPFRYPHSWFGIDTGLIMYPGNERIDRVMAASREGRGFVFAAACPWVNNHSLNNVEPSQINDNNVAMINLARWLLTADMDQPR